eukprot:m.88271 g.88271  ORF g.88271 m.88271 type:complete len:417 (-) comp13156_c1_seq1:42-1292(-)
MFKLLALFVVANIACSTSFEYKLDFNDIHRKYDGYSKIIEVAGYHASPLCGQINRTKPIDGNDKCPLVVKNYKLWPYDASTTTFECCFQNMKVYYNKDAKPVLQNAPGENVTLGSCPKNNLGVSATGYDWRYGAIRPNDDHDRLKTYIESIVEKDANNKRIVLYCHSFGTIYCYGFLRHMEQTWKDKHILAFVPVVPVFGGAFASMISVLWGWKLDNMDRCNGRTFAPYIPSVLWMWPRPGKKPWFWEADEVLISGDDNKQNFTASDLPKLLTAIGLKEDVLNIYNTAKNDALNDFKPVNVDTYALYGYNVKTASGMSFKTPITTKDFGPGVCVSETPQYRVKEEDNGDGVGSLRSTSRATAWMEAHKNANFVLWNKGYQNMRHCEFCTPESKQDWTCLQAYFGGKELPAACKLFS